MADALHSSFVEKYSLGRGSLGIMNWKKRFMYVSPIALKVAETTTSVNPKLDVPIQHLSMLFTNPTSRDHPEATKPYCFMLRLFDGGAYNLLVHCDDDADKAKWINAIRTATKRNKGFQVIEKGQGDTPIPSPPDEEPDAQPALMDVPVNDVEDGASVADPSNERDEVINGADI